MNFLAHIYLSGDNDLIKIGNFMAGSGNNLKIILWMFRKELSSSRHWYFYWCPSCFRQSTKNCIQDTIITGVIVDVFYDHFLAKLGVFNENLSDFVLLQSERKHSHFKWKNGDVDALYDQNWLLSYQTIEGINNILTQMDGRTKINQKCVLLEELRELYTEFEEDFTDFLTIWERMRNKINRRIIFFNHKKMKFFA
jgi:acyl carrier protein phosphodiesterase